MMCAYIFAEMAKKKQRLSPPGLEPGTSTFSTNRDLIRMSVMRCQLCHADEPLNTRVASYNLRTLKKSPLIGSCTCVFETVRV
jgi:hypothetical protein